MKKIKIFLASSKELAREREALGDLVGHLNYTLNKIDLNIILSKWEYFDSSVSLMHKQEEYNKELRECEICVVLYWTKFGEYTKIEFDVAYDGFKSGRNPRKLYVGFKTSSEGMSSELKLFRDSFSTNYGHFYGEFDNMDTLKTAFLLQFLEYHTVILKNSGFVELRDASVYVSGKSVVNLKNVAFIGNNEAYNQLLRSIRRTRKLLDVTDVTDPEYSVYAQELQDDLNRQQEMEENLWQTALNITRLSTSTSSERLQRAIDCFNQGDNMGADAILNEAKIDRDVDYNLRLFEFGEEGRKGLMNNIEELKLKINILKNERTEGWSERVCAVYDKAIILTERIHGNTSKELADILGSAAYDFSVLGKYQQALLYNTKALKIQLILFDEKHLDVATSYRDIGSVYYKRGNYTDALNYSTKALEIYLAVLNETHSDVAATYYVIGLIYAAQNQNDKALNFYTKSLKIRLAVFGETHPDVAVNYASVGHVYATQGKNNKALDYYTKSLKIMLTAYGENDPSVAPIYNNIGLVYYEQENYVNALNYYTKALAIRLVTFGENHPDVATNYNNIGLVYYRQGNYADALSYYVKAQKILLAVCSENSPDVAKCYDNIGLVYYNLGNYTEALSYYVKAQKILLAVFNEIHSDVAINYVNIGGVYVAQGEINKAMNCFTKARNILLTIYDKNHPYVKIVRNYIEMIK